MVERLYSDYDAPITVRATKGKTFTENPKIQAQIEAISGVKSVSRAVEEVVVLKHEKKWVNATMVGVDSNFLQTCKINNHTVDGFPSFGTNQAPFAIIGASLMDKLEAFQLPNGDYESILLYTPLRDARIGRSQNPFKSCRLLISARMNYNREVNAGQVMVPLDLAQTQLKYGSDITAYYVDVDENADRGEVKNLLEQQLGKTYTVKTAYEKNELIFKTSETEKRIVILILAFVFILAAFNLVASITMLYAEKKDDIVTLSCMGMQQKQVFQLFFLEGMLVAIKGIVIGLLLGVGVCLVQVFGAFLVMPNSGGEAFPIAFSAGDGLLILSLVVLLSALSSAIPVYFMVYKRTDK